LSRFLNSRDSAFSGSGMLMMIGFSHEAPPDPG
jgi:hypothetical protein